jgi:ParB family chromosome partitioning protein
MTEKIEKPKHLGRGLASLLSPITINANNTSLPIPITEIGSNVLPDKGLGASLKEIKVDDIQPNPYQVRSIWNEQELLELAKSIKANGVIQPIIVRHIGSSSTGLPQAGYQLIAGERRWRACKLAGIETVPAIVREVNDDKMLELALVENIHRTDLNPIERANAYQKYINTLSLTQSQAGDRLGEDRSVIANYLRLLDLPTEIKQMLRKLANRAMAGRLSVREIERLVRMHITADEKQLKPARIRSAHIQDLESRLSKELGTNVSIETRKKGKCGKIVIEFHSLEEFDRIIQQIGLTSAEEV